MYHWRCACASCDHRKGLPTTCDNFIMGRIELVDPQGQIILRGWATYADDSGLDITLENQQLIVDALNAYKNKH